MRISLTLSEADHAALCQQAADKRLSVSSYIITTMMQHIASNPQAVEAGLTQAARRLTEMTGRHPVPGTVTYPPDHYCDECDPDAMRPSCDRNKSCFRAYTAAKNR